MVKQLNFTAKENYARTLSISELEHAIQDCRLCIREGVDPDYYRDEISVYQQELSKRTKKTVRAKVVSTYDGWLG